MAADNSADDQMSAPPRSNVVVGAVLISACSLALIGVLVLRRRLALASARADSARRKVRPLLVLHLDVNETLILSDPAGGDTYVDSLNKIVAKLALVRPVNVDDPRNCADDVSEADAAVLARWTWIDGSPLDPAARDPLLPAPPLAKSTWDTPNGVVRFYTVPALKRRFARTFCTSSRSPGKIYQRVYDEADHKLRWPVGASTATPLCKLDDGTPRHFILPAALVAISALARRGREFQIVIRTFGSDLDDVASALSAFARGEHPDFPLLDLPAAKPDSARPEPRAPHVRIPQASLSPARCFVGRYTRAGGFTLAPGPHGPSMRVLSDEAEIARLVSRPGNLGSGDGWAAASRAGHSAALGISDDYAHWSSHGCAPWSGKPLWLTADDRETVSLFLDDNIHDDALDSIVAMRVRSSAAGHEAAALSRRPRAARHGVAHGGDGRFAPLSGEATRALRGLALVPVPTLHAVLDSGWILREIDACEARVASARESARAAGYGDDWVAWAVEQPRQRGADDANSTAGASGLAAPSTHVAIAVTIVPA